MLPLTKAQQRAGVQAGRAGVRRPSHVSTRRAIKAVRRRRTANGFSFPFSSLRGSAWPHPPLLTGSDDRKDGEDPKDRRIPPPPPPPVRGVDSGRRSFSRRPPPLAVSMLLLQNNCCLITGESGKFHNEDSGDNRGKRVGDSDWKRWVPVTLWDGDYGIWGEVCFTKLVCFWIYKLHFFYPFAIFFSVKL